MTPGTDATKWKLFIDNSAAVQAATAANAAAAAANAAAASAANATTYIAPVESSSTAANAYEVDDQLIYNGVLYRVTAAIAIGDTLATTGAGENISAVDGGVTGEIGDLKGEINSIGSVVSTPFTWKDGYYNISTGNFYAVAGTYHSTNKFGGSE